MLACTIFLLTSCGDDEDKVKDQFKVTITNNFSAKDYFDSGTLEAVGPGDDASISFNAGKGHYLQFATMYVQSNDIFLGPDDSGIALYDMSGTALTGDITSMIDLWDAGTEVNEEPGVGPNQPPRQAAANTGETENGNVVLISDVNDGFTYPELDEISKISLSHDGGTLFTLTISNISESSSLPTPFAPGVWVIHTADQLPIFEEGNSASVGLEAIAEDGNNSIISESLSSNSGLVSPFAPGAYNVGSTNEIFSRNGANTPEIEALAEDGDPAGFANVFNTPDGASSPDPIFPMGSYSFTFEAEENDKLSLGLMLVQSNDWFIGLNEYSIYTNGMANTGDITSNLSLYESGTEVDEYPGAGNSQAPRQSGPNTGTAEDKNVAPVDNPNDNVPSIQNMIQITLEKI